MHFLKRRRLFGIRPHMHYLDAQPLSQRFKTHAGYIDFRLFAPAFRDGPVEYLSVTNSGWRKKKALLTFHLCGAPTRK